MMADLGLSAAQQAKVDAIQAEYRPKMMAAFQGGDRDAARAVGGEMRAKIDAVLTPDQRTKLAAAREKARAAGGGFGGGPQ